MPKRSLHCPYKVVGKRGLVRGKRFIAGARPVGEVDRVSLCVSRGGVIKRGKGRGIPFPLPYLLRFYAGARMRGGGRGQCNLPHPLNISEFSTYYNVSFVEVTQKRNVGDRATGCLGGKG